MGAAVGGDATLLGTNGAAAGMITVTAAGTTTGAAIKVGATGVGTVGDIIGGGETTAGCAAKSSAVIVVTLAGMTAADGGGDKGARIVTGSSSGSGKATED